MTDEKPIPILICGTRTLAPGEYGKPPILVEQDKLCGDCNQRHEFEACPECGSWIGCGFGLMSGGFGEYKFCLNDKCAWFWKRIWANDEE